MKLQRPAARSFVAWSLAILSIAGIANSIYVASVEAHWRSANPASRKRAVDLAPGYTRLLATYANSESDVQLLRTATHFQPRLTAAWIELAVHEEMRGRPDVALRALLNAERHDKGYQPRWALANYYLRQNRPEQFWDWAKRCASVLYGRHEALVDLCLRVDANRAYQRLGPSDANFQRQFVDRASQHHSDASLEAARDLARHGSAKDRERLLLVIDQYLGRGRSEAALDVWNELARSGIIPYPVYSANAELLTNGAFQERPLGKGFDWRLYPDASADVVADGRLRVTLSGSQKQLTVLAEQHIPVQPGSLLQLSVETTSGAAGLAWMFVPTHDWQRPLVELDAEAAGRKSAEVRVPGDVRLVRLALLYRRPQGAMRAEGFAEFRGVTVRRLSS